MVMAAGTLSLGVGSANAEPSCPSGSTACVWESQGYTQRVIYFGNAREERRMKSRKIGAFDDMDNRISSLISTYDGHLCFYDLEDFGGVEFKIGPKEKWATIPWWIDNKISSFKVC